MAKPALGRGLGALLGGVATTIRNGASAPPLPPAGPSAFGGDVARMAPIARIHPSPLQPRKEFPAQALQELAASIKDKGIVQPLLVREREGHFELIAGERRWRAAQLLGLAEAPVIVKQVDDRTALELALVENLQREDLNPMEEAFGYRQLIDQFKLSQEEAAAKLGKSRAALTNALRLLNLPAEVQNWLRDGRLQAGHAKVILGLASPEQQTLAAQRVVKDGLTVRQVEELVAHWVARARAGAAVVNVPPARVPVRDAHVVALEGKLRERFGTKVGLRYREGKGSLEVRFYSDGELERILQIVGVQAD
jgi:ParB family transcriptional regulator, chromosome partitioning protein